MQDVDVSHLWGLGWPSSWPSVNRWPADVSSLIPAKVYDLGYHTSGIHCTFSAQTSTLAIDFKLRYTEAARLAMPHLAQTCMSGFDVYARRSSAEPWTYVANFTSSCCDGDEKKTQITGVDDTVPMQWRIYFPLYNGVKHLSVSADRPVSFCVPPPSQQPVDIVFYGTSIQQGACASRPGLNPCSLVARSLGDLHVIDLGFSGSGRMEREVIDTIARLRPRLFVLQCAHNMDAELVAANCSYALETLHKIAPVLLVEGHTRVNNWIFAEQSAAQLRRRQEFKKAYNKYRDCSNVFYLAGDGLIGEDGEGTVDGLHPNDLGHHRMAIRLSETISDILQK